MSRAPMTKAGAEKLRAELKELKSVKRPKVIQAIAEAREHGDLKENAEYHAAREQQSFIEGRIKEIEGKLSHANIIDVSNLDAGTLSFEIGDLTIDYSAAQLEDFPQGGPADGDLVEITAAFRSFATMLGQLRARVEAERSGDLERAAAEKAAAYRPPEH